MPPNLAPLSGAYKKVAVVRELEADDQTEFELLRLRGAGGTRPVSRLVLRRA